MEVWKGRSEGPLSTQLSRTSFGFWYTRRGALPTLLRFLGTRLLRRGGRVTTNGSAAAAAPASHPLTKARKETLIAIAPRPPSPRWLLSAGAAPLAVAAEGGTQPRRARTSSADSSTTLGSRRLLSEAEKVDLAKQPHTATPRCSRAICPPVRDHGWVEHRSCGSAFLLRPPPKTTLNFSDSSFTVNSFLGWW